VYTTENALTFADMAKAVQRSAGLGQVTNVPLNCLNPDGSVNLDCLPDLTTPGTNFTATVGTPELTAGEQPYYQTVLGMQIPTSTLLIGGIIAAIALGAAFLGGARR
jgi:hypothetical protein